MSKPKKILIIEDDNYINDAYTLLLTKSGYTVANAFDGNEGLEQIEKFKPDMILLDLRMPHLDGIGVLSKLTDKQKESMHIIVLSNYDMQKEIDQAYKLGAERYILKAWASPHDLTEIVKDTLAK